MHFYFTKLFQAHFVNYGQGERGRGCFKIKQNGQNIKIDITQKLYK